MQKKTKPGQLSVFFVIERERESEKERKREGGSQSERGRQRKREGGRQRQRERQRERERQPYVQKEGYSFSFPPVSRTLVYFLISLKICFRVRGCGQTPLCKQRSRLKIQSSINRRDKQNHPALFCGHLITLLMTTAPHLESTDLTFPRPRTILCTKH